MGEEPTTNEVASPEEHQLEARKRDAIFLCRLRSLSRYKDNMSAGARAAGMTPSHLHMAEHAEIKLSNDEIILLMGAYAPHVGRVLEAYRAVKDRPGPEPETER